MQLKIKGLHAHLLEDQRMRNSITVLLAAVATAASCASYAAPPPAPSMTRVMVVAAIVITVPLLSVGLWRHARLSRAP